MLSEKMIEQFFDEHFKDTFGLFLYKDKQLLKQKDYKGFAKHQLEKSRKNFRGALLFSAMFVILGGAYIAQHAYGNEALSFNLVLGLSYFFFAFLSQLFVVKEHYSIKTSMNLLLMMLNKQSAEIEEKADLVIESY